MSSYPKDDIVRPYRDIVLSRRGIVLCEDELGLPDHYIVLPRRDMVLLDDERTLSNREIVPPERDSGLVDRDIVLKGDACGIPNRGIVVLADGGLTAHGWLDLLGPRERTEYVRSP